MDEVECIVIGGGVIGLACGASIARSGREVLVLEAEDAIGTHTSSRNSEVVHAGIYYPKGSLKALLCRRGRDMLYRYAEERSIPHRRIGKLIVATSPEQLAQLAQIADRAAGNGVEDLRHLSPRDVSAMEPALRSSGALLSPSTGIIDSHALMLALEAELQEHGGMVVLRTEVTAIEPQSSGFIVETRGAEAGRIRARHIINCAGLRAIGLAQQIAQLNEDTVPQAHFSVGHYYRLSGPSPCERLVYPVPEPGGLGIHLTLDLANQAKFGPDVRWIAEPDYRFDDSARDRFAAAIQTYLPGITADDLVPDYTGVRPKIVGPNEPDGDFRIDGANHHGVPGLINLFGIESPGLTASLAIADHVAQIID
ncbi:NAD(P)/FAD-dependent oxidoreductase [Erythrobacter rubeus]|uniref:NAD(P)/FAD-dependent oxidoreductase n=1 Tax=Erythrobacter rubeus TaxID=2760803 RepID=A0ABR8KPS8_9SPHN|nr:NAD(P)/FAD-dependent oxidoreductase [Erythrobacter rubeus]MBD2841008.1 NAD(P)/FAD-dependent oxidoreductase [Erythrobacter rubeus]